MSRHVQALDLETGLHPPRTVMVWGTALFRKRADFHWDREKLPPKRRENTYYPEAMTEWLRDRRLDVVFLGRGSNKFLRMDTTPDGGVVG